MTSSTTAAKGTTSYWYLCEVCLLTSNDFRNDEHSEVTEGRTCEGVCNICEKEANTTSSSVSIKTCLCLRRWYSLQLLMNYCYGRVGGPESNAPQHLPQKFRLLRQFFDACLEYTWIGTSPAYLWGDMTCKLRISPDEHNIITPVKAHTRTARSILGFTHSSGHRASSKTMANQAFSAFLASPAPRASILVSDWESFLHVSSRSVLRYIESWSPS